MATKWDLTSGTGIVYNEPYPKQNIKLVQTSAPTLTIVDTTVTKNYLKVGSDTTDDDLILDLIKAATKIVEQEAGGLCICEQTWKQYQKGGVDEIELLRQPVLNVSSVNYYEDFDSSAVAITVSTHYRAVENDLYHVDGYWEQGRDGDGYVTEFTAGKYTASSYTNADPALKTAILRIVAWLYENREEYVTNISEGNWSVTYAGELPQGLKRLIMPFHTGKGLI